MRVKNLEKKIWDLEGFAVRVIAPTGRDARDDHKISGEYDYSNRAKNSMTVSEWKQQRFSRCFPGYDVEVLNGNGEVCAGNTVLGNVRDSYLEE